MPLEIEILSGPLRGKRVKLPPGIHIVGRGLGPLPFQDLGLSQEHAKIHVFAHRIEVEDVGSTNGTYVNGSRVARQVLKDGDEVRLGPESTFRVMGDEKMDTKPSAPSPSLRSNTMQTATPVTTTESAAPPINEIPRLLGSGLNLQPPRKDGAKAWVRAAFIVALVVGGALLAYGLSRMFAV